MTDRVSKIILRADIRDLQAKMVAAGKSVSDFGDRITNQDKKSVKFRQGLTSVGDAAGKMGLVAAAGLGAAVVASARFDSAISKVQAATHESANSMDALRAAAIKAGADTAFSATEAADAITAMAKAGVSTKDILAGGLNGALSLASAGELDVAQSAEIAATAMTQFGLSGKDIPHIADLLAAGAGKAQGEVTDMAQALKYVGPVAHQMGISIEETAGAIAELAAQGILGDQAGTSLRGMLTSLTSPSKLAAKEMATLGIQLYDARGQFVGFSGVAEQLHETMGNLTNAERDQTLGRIFGNEQITAARILYAGGAADVDKWTKAVNDNGYAAETAAIKMDNLAGDFEKLKGSLETLLITGGDGSQGFLRGVVQGADDATGALNSLPGPAKNAALALTAITAVTGGALFLGSRVVTSIANTRTALDQLAVSGSRVGTAFNAVKRGGVALLALEGIVQVADVIGTSFVDAYPGVERLTQSLLELQATGAGGELAKKYGDISDAIHQVGDPNLAERVGHTIATIISLGTATDSPELKQGKKEIESLDAAFANLATSGSPELAASAFKKFAAETGLNADQQKALLTLLPQYKEALAGIDNSATLAGGSVDGLTDSTATNTTATEDNTKATEDAIKARRQLADDTLAAFDAETAYQRALNEGKDRQAEKKKIQDEIADIQKGGVKDSEKGRLADLQAQLKEYANTLDKTTVAGQANRDVLSHMADTWNNLGAEQKNAKGAYHDAREALIKQAEQFGLTRKQAERYIDRLKLDIPPRVTTRIELNKQRAQAALDAFSKAFKGLDGKTAKAFVELQQKHNAGDPRIQDGFADGGYTGPGGKYEPAGIVHRGEFVIDAEQTMRHRALLEAIHRRAPGYAQGGYVREQRAQMRGYAGGGYVTGGGVSIDYDRLSAAMLSARPLVGHQTVMPHNYSEFVRQQDANERLTSMGSESFRV